MSSNSEDTNLNPATTTTTTTPTTSSGTQGTNTVQVSPVSQEQENLEQANQAALQQAANTPQPQPTPEEKNKVESKEKTSEWQHAVNKLGDDKGKPTDVKDPMQYLVEWLLWRMIQLYEYNKEKSQRKNEEKDALTRQDAKQTKVDVTPLDLNPQTPTKSVNPNDEVIAKKTQAPQQPENPNDIEMTEFSQIKPKAENTQTGPQTAPPPQEPQLLDQSAPPHVESNINDIKDINAIEELDDFTEPKETTFDLAAQEVEPLAGLPITQPGGKPDVEPLAGLPISPPEGTQQEEIKPN